MTNQNIVNQQYIYHFKYNVIQKLHLDMLEHA